MTTTRRKVLIALVALLAVIGILTPFAWNLLSGSSASDRISADPQPQLFPAAVTTAAVDQLVAPESAKAHELMAGWWAQHGQKADDAAFTAWVEKTFPAPPATAARSAEMKQVEALATKRTATGTAAATWLEGFGKKDIWKVLAHEQGDWVAAKVADQRKAELKDGLKLSKSLADSLGTRFGVSAPYVIEPSLRPDHHVAAGQKCPCSYPSRHASAAAASRTLLGTLAPQTLGEYRWYEDQIDYSRLYMAGHVASDLTGGALLGDMVGEYILVTREGVDPSTLGATPAQ
jgi:membrane-associated phospholipid phosphatase